MKQKLKTFIIEIHMGKPKFTSESQRGLFLDFLAQFNGKKVWLTIDPRIPSRSDRQNRYYWLYLGIIASETGDDPEELHEVFKKEFLKKGEKEILGKKIELYKSTTALNKFDFADYMEKICRLTEVPLPDTSIFELGITHEEFARRPLTKVLK